MPPPRLGPVRKQPCSRSHGLTGPGTAFDGRRGVLRVFGAAAQFEAPEDIGARFHIEDNILKLQPAVGTVHAAVEAIEVLPRTSGFPIDRIDDIVRIDVGLVDCAVAHGGHISRPTDALSAQLSLAFSVALRLVRGRNAVQDYLDPGNWTDPSLLAVADKVICHAKVFEPGAPEPGATVSLLMADGGSRALPAGLPGPLERPGHMGRPRTEVPCPRRRPHRAGCGRRDRGLRREARRGVRREPPLPSDDAGVTTTPVSQVGRSNPNSLIALPRTTLRRVSSDITCEYCSTHFIESGQVLSVCG